MVFFLFAVKSFVPPGIQCRFRGKWHSKKPDYHKTIERKVMYHLCSLYHIMWHFLNASLMVTWFLYRILDHYFLDAQKHLQVLSNSRFSKILQDLFFRSTWWLILPKHAVVLWWKQMILKRWALVFFVDYSTVSPQLKLNFDSS